MPITALAATRFVYANVAIRVAITHAMPYPPPYTDVGNGKAHGLEEMQVEEYRIVPWDQDESVPFGVDREFYIPPEIEAIAREVLTKYDMMVSVMTLITSKPDKGGAIWRLETDKGPRSLKVLHREPRRSLFSVYAQKWLVEQGARVPALIKTIEGNLYVEAGGKLWIVTDWISLVPASKYEIEGAEALVYGLGEFHRASRGYVAPDLAQRASRIHHWPKYYAKMIEKIGWFRDLARAYPEAAGANELLNVVEEFQQEASDAMARFEQSSYHKMVAKGERHWGLVHQDYGFSNGQLGPGGIWVIDLDGVSYDFPIRDLRKIITSMMDDRGVWDTGVVRRLIEAYHKANPIDRETFELLVIDMAFPNEFYKHIKEMIFDPELFMNTEMGPILDRVLMTQESKRAALEELQADAVNYEPGDYSEPTLAERREARMRWLEENGPLFEPLLIARGLDSIGPTEADADGVSIEAISFAAAETPLYGAEGGFVAAADVAANAAANAASNAAADVAAPKTGLQPVPLHPMAGASVPVSAPVFAALPAGVPVAAGAIPAAGTFKRTQSATSAGVVRRRRALRKRKSSVRRRRPKLTWRRRRVAVAKRITRRSRSLKASSAKRTIVRRTTGAVKGRTSKKRSRIAARRA